MQDEQTSLMGREGFLERAFLQRKGLLETPEHGEGVSSWELGLPCSV